MDNVYFQCNWSSAINQAGKYVSKISLETLDCYTTTVEVTLKHNIYKQWMTALTYKTMFNITLRRSKTVVIMDWMIGDQRHLYFTSENQWVLV